MLDWRLGVEQQTDQVPPSGYALYSALCSESPDLKPRDDWQLVMDGQVGVRGPVGLVGALRQLEGKLLRVGGGGVLLGSLSVRRLVPSEVVRAEHVVLCDRHYETFDERMIRWGMSLQRRLDGMGLSCGVSIEKAEGVRISRQHLRTYSIELHGLSDDESLRVQSEGIGSKRKQGCGVFVPVGA